MEERRKEERGGRALARMTVSGAVRRATAPAVPLERDRVPPTVREPAVFRSSMPPTWKSPGVKRGKGRRSEVKVIEFPAEMPKSEPCMKRRSLGS